MLDNINNLAIYIPSLFHYVSDSEDDMASPTESRRGTAQRRDSSRSSSRRPRLLRSSATEPSITPSTASRNALATPGTSRRATDLLNQVAISTSPPNSSSPLSQSPTMYDSPARIARDHVDLDGFRPHLGMSSSSTRVPPACFNVIGADYGLVSQQTQGAISVSLASTPGSPISLRRSGSLRCRCRCRCSRPDSTRGCRHPGPPGWNGNGNYEEFGSKHARPIERPRYSTSGTRPDSVSLTTKPPPVAQRGLSRYHPGVSTTTQSSKCRCLLGCHVSHGLTGREREREKSLGPGQSVDQGADHWARGETWAQHEVIGLVTFLQQWHTMGAQNRI